MRFPAARGNGWALSANDAILAMPGFFHCNGWAVPFFGPMYGAGLVLPGRRADAAFLHQLIVEEGITVAPGVPTIFLDLLAHCRESGASLGRLNRIFSGGTAPPDGNDARPICATMASAPFTAGA